MCRLFIESCRMNFEYKPNLKCNACRPIHYGDDSLLMLTITISTGSFWHANGHSDRERICAPFNYWCSPLLLSHSVDARKGQSLDAARRVTDENLASRSYMSTTTHPYAHLILELLTPEDAGEYACRVDFRKARTRNSVVFLKVISKCYSCCTFGLLSTLITRTHTWEHIGKYKISIAMLTKQQPGCSENTRSVGRWTNKSATHNSLCEAASAAGGTQRNVAAKWWTSLERCSRSEANCVSVCQWWRTAPNNLVPAHIVWFMPWKWPLENWRAPLGPARVYCAATVGGRRFVAACQCSQQPIDSISTALGAVRALSLPSQSIITLVIVIIDANYYYYYHYGPSTHTSAAKQQQEHLLVGTGAVKCAALHNASTAPGTGK